MANIKSQIKRNKQNEKRHQRNKAVKSSLKTAIRKFREAAEAGDKEQAITLGARPGEDHPPADHSYIWRPAVEEDLPGDVDLRVVRAHRDQHRHHHGGSGDEPPAGDPRRRSMSDCRSWSAKSSRNQRRSGAFSGSRPSTSTRAPKVASGPVL